ncbi:hypothetical protein HK104_009016 [Borealophlyctis nickersoniae]|nr:hypothetical protein HK104_009016 [Borealophlyctis nickersoniae]
MSLQTASTSEKARPTLVQDNDLPSVPYAPGPRHNPAPRAPANLQQKRMPSLTLLVELATGQTSVAKDAEIAAALLEIESRYPLNRWMLKFVDPDIEREFWTKYSEMATKHNFYVAAVCAVVFAAFLGLLMRNGDPVSNQLALSYCYEATSLTQFGTQLSCYGFCALAAVSQCYLFESCLRAVFVMEHVVASARNIPTTAVTKRGLDDLLEEIKNLREQRSVMALNMGADREGDSPSMDARQEGSGSGYVEGRGGVANVNACASDREYGCGHKKMLRDDSWKAASHIIRSTHVVANSDIDHLEENVTSENAEAPVRARPKGFRARAYRFWKDYVYLVWEDSEIEKEYLEFQNTTFRSLSRMNIILLFAAEMLHIYLDVNTIVESNPVMASNGLYIYNATGDLFSVYAFNTLFSGFSLPPHHFQILLLLAALTNFILCYLYNLIAWIFIGHVALIVAIGVTGGRQSAACESLSRRHFLLRRLVKDVWRNGGFKVAGVEEAAQGDAWELTGTGVMEVQQQQ